MLRLAIVSLFCFVCMLAQPLLGSEKHAPWVSCFSQTPTGDGAWEGPKTVRTPLVVSLDGKMKAYARIEAKAGGPVGCHNTVRLFVSTPGQGGFRQVFMQKASIFDGTANSLGPNSWSPDGRWLLVEFAQESYASDCCGIAVLLYDSKKR